MIRSRSNEVGSVAFVGDYVPRQCGIATFTHDLLQAVAKQYPASQCVAVPVNNRSEGYDYPPEVRFEFHEQDLDSYRRAADFLNFSDVDVVSLQHEFNIYGGQSGGHILALLRDLRMPVVTTLHTINAEPTKERRLVMQQLIDLSARVVAMSEKGVQFLKEVYEAPDEKIDLIPHGIPDMPFVDPNFYKDQFGVEGKYVALTFGLLSPSKGIEYVLRALPEVLREFPNFVYIVLGATHPNILRDQGETYRLSLERLTKDLGVDKHVIFFNRFVDLEDLMEFIGAADIYITPYLRQDQITSGTLAYSFGCGKAVISTPYWHAQELLADGRGVLVPFRDAAAVAREIIGLLRDEPRRHAMRKRAYLLGRDMVWSNVAHLYMESFQKARRSRARVRLKRFAMRTQDEKPHALPQFRLNHLAGMTDATGVLRHATYTVPNYRDGYAVADNAAALVLCALLEELGLDSPERTRIGAAAAAVLDYAFDADRGGFFGQLGFDRRWRGEPSWDEPFGQALWALGVAVGRSARRPLQSWAVGLFQEALPGAERAGSPRVWAAALLGIHEYLRRLSGDRMADQIRHRLTDRLLERFARPGQPDWPWCDERVALGDARIPHALVLSGYWTGHEGAFDTGLRALEWLAQIQRSPAGHFRPLGGGGHTREGRAPSRFEQHAAGVQPMISACIEAYRTTQDRTWLDAARNAFEWFMGRNDLAVPLYDSQTGGCCDGLHQDRRNENQGAAATLSFLISLAELKILENQLASFQHPAAP